MIRFATRLVPARICARSVFVLLRRFLILSLCVCTNKFSFLLLLLGTYTIVLYASGDNRTTRQPLINEYIYMFMFLRLLLYWANGGGDEPKRANLNRCSESRLLHSIKWNVFCAFACACVRASCRLVMTLRPSDCTWRCSALLTRHFTALPGTAAFTAKLLYLERKRGRPKKYDEICLSLILCFCWNVLARYILTRAAAAFADDWWLMWRIGVQVWYWLLSLCFCSFWFLQWRKLLLYWFASVWAYRK